MKGAIFQRKYEEIPLLTIVADGYKIATMVKSSISSYRWPYKEDKLVYIREHIQKKSATQACVLNVGHALYLK